MNERAIIEAARSYGGYEGPATLGVGHGQTLLEFARKQAKGARITAASKAVLEAAGEPVPDLPVVPSILDARQRRAKPSRRTEESNEVLRERVRRLEKRVAELETELAWVGRHLPAAPS